ncbi:DIP2 disco-interacting protein 2 C [Saguinus oedipus]|uniref:DIP2 disco-interacting protein 2 C n=1 Tax=Saguinus oedipus TaxID=9490 RepID=A0ABQ9V7N1_SAGOE|nr:DIP2 disco-interacting protein 2 C [Saguinus oedipus]
MSYARSPFVLDGVADVAESGFGSSRHTQENHSAPPDVTTYTSEHSIQVERPQGSTGSRTAPKYGNAELMETGDGVPVSSRVSAKIQQLVNTLKRPKRPPLREFFVDDFEELLEDAPVVP